MNNLEKLKYYLFSDLLLWYPEKLPLSEFLDTKKEQHTAKMGIVSMQECISGNGSKPVLRNYKTLFGSIRHKNETFECISYLYNVILDDNEKISYYDFKEIFELKLINQLEFSVFQKLIEWHIDLFDWIEKGIAVDYNCC